MKFLAAIISNIDSFFDMTDSIRQYFSGDWRSFYNLEIMFGYIFNFGARFLFDLLN